jgi:hypothetical protein
MSANKKLKNDDYKIMSFGEKQEIINKVSNVPPVPVLM